MVRKLQIKLFDAHNQCRKVIITGHLDASRNITILSDSTIDEKKIGDVHIPEKIDHFNIFEGLITIYYQSGYYLEVQRLLQAG